uniref:Uncharacterized protein n=1 Tax=Anguilla anguilla TaxID=7936 RepID=A0A0E9TGB7_ANGAN
MGSVSTDASRARCPQSAHTGNDITKHDCFRAIEGGNNG